MIGGNPSSTKVGLVQVQFSFTKVGLERLQVSFSTRVGLEQLSVLLII